MSFAVTAAVIDSAIEDQGELIVAIMLANWSDDEGLSYPSLTKLAHKARLSKRTVQRKIKDLEDAGFLKVHNNKGPNGTNLFALNLANLRGLKGVTHCHPGGDTVTPGGVTESPQGGDSVSPNTIKILSKEREGGDRVTPPPSPHEDLGGHKNPPSDPSTDQRLLEMWAAQVKKKSGTCAQIKAHQARRMHELNLITADELKEVGIFL